MTIQESGSVGSSLCTGAITGLRNSAMSLLLGLALACGAGAEPAAVVAHDLQSQSKALQRAAAAVVGLQATAVENARSNRALGRSRSGSGVVIGSDGLVLTIGYLILEAEQVQLITDDDRVVPARVVGYDLATGFGLVQALAPLKIAPAPLVQGDRIDEGEPLLVASGGEEGAVGMARLVSRRPFSGYWEYHLEDALFTAPARSDHSGAGLFDAQGRLLGIGSLFVADAMGTDRPRLPGNMFVPVDLLRPILAELRNRGTTSLSQRAWIGVNCIQHDGSVRVARINEDSPADVAGLEVGDQIVSIDGTSVSTLDMLWKMLWSGGPAERTVVLQILRSGESRTLQVYSVDRAKTLRRAEGV